MGIGPSGQRLRWHCPIALWTLRITNQLPKAHMKLFWTLLLLAPTQHQQKSPVCGAVKSKLCSVQNNSVVIHHSCENTMSMEQLNCDTAWLCSNAGARPLWLCWSALLCSALLRHLWCCSFRPETTVLDGKGKCSLRARGELTYLHRSPHL